MLSDFAVNIPTKRYNKQFLKKYKLIFIITGFI